MPIKERYDLQILLNLLSKRQFIMKSSFNENVSYFLQEKIVQGKRKGARSRNLRPADIWFNGATANGSWVQPIYKKVYIR